MTGKSPIRLLTEPLAIAIALAVVVRLSCRIYSIPSASMAPALVAGDQIVVTPYRFFEDRPRRGDVIVFRSPMKEKDLLVKRVIGLPGDFIESREGRLRIGTHTLAEPYVRDATSTGPLVPQIVPADSLYVLGDNRSHSFDSRNWGPLPLDRVVGRARLVLFSTRNGASTRNPHASTLSPPVRSDPRPLLLDRLFLVID